MQKYILGRFFSGIIAITLLAVIVFVLLRATGNPLDLLLPLDASEELRKRVEIQLGLDRTIIEQFLIFMNGILHGDFGQSVRYRLPVLELFQARIFASLSLILPAFALAFLAGIPLGVVAAINRGRSLGRIAGVVGVVGMAAPSFWLALVLILIFAVTLGWLPAARMGGADHYVLPVVTLSVFLVAGIMRLVRSSMLEALDSEYVKLARLKGVSEQAVIWNHALRNSLTTTISFAGVYFAVLITGTIVIEKVFAWPGVGRLLYEGIMFRDYPVVQGLIILKGALIVGVNLLVDILYCYLDPRIRY